MSEAVIVALLSLAGTVIGSLLGMLVHSAAAAGASLVTYRLEQLELKVNKHNNLVERMAVAEKRIETHGKEIDALRGEVHELEISG